MSGQQKRKKQKKKALFLQREDMGKEIGKMTAIMDMMRSYISLYGLNYYH